MRFGLIYIIVQQRNKIQQFKIEEEIDTLVLMVSIAVLKELVLNALLLL